MLSKFSVKKPYTVLVGVILVISLLTIPQMTAMIFTGNYKKIITLSILLGYAASAAGLFLSFALDIPGGASVILCSIALYAACAIGKSITRKLAPQ